MTNNEVHEYIRSDLAARAAAANIEINDEWDFPAETDFDAQFDAIYPSRCEDAPCCGCCGTNLYGVNQEDDGDYYDDSDVGAYDCWNDQYDE